MSIAWPIRVESAARPGPPGWEVRRVGDLVTLVNGYPFPSDSFAPSGDMPLVRIRDLETGRFETYVTGEIPASVVLRNGDVVIGMDGDFNLVVWDRGEAALNQRLCVLRPRPAVDIRFVAYSLRNSLKIINDLAFSTTVKHLSSLEVLSERLLVPPLEEQRRIADFLDAEASRIERLRKRWRALRSLLHERLRASIFSGVAGHREATTERRPSGLSWLGSVPTSWPVMPVGFQFEVMLGKMLNQERIHGDHLRPYLRNTNVQWDRIDTSDLLLMDFTPEERTRYRVLPGDLLVCEGGEPGRAATWNGPVEEVYYQKALHRVRPRGYSAPRWLYYCIRAATDQNVFAIEGNTTTIAHLTGEQLSSHRFPFPARPTQDRLVAELDALAVEHAELVSRLARQEELLTERRQALTTAAVTGEFDVSSASGRRAAG